MACSAGWNWTAESDSSRLDPNSGRSAGRSELQGAAIQR